MRSGMIGKSKVVMTVLGFTLSTSGFLNLRGEELDSGAKAYAFRQFRKHIAFLTPQYIRDYWNHTGANQKNGDMEPHRVTYTYDSDDWRSVYTSELPHLQGYLPLKADACVSDKIETSIVEGDKSARCIQRCLNGLTEPRFACVFFPLEMFRRVFLKCTNVYGKCEYRWILRGELSCDIKRKRLKKDSAYFDDLGEYIFYFVRYEEKLSGCIFEMLYCFKADGMMVGWCPSKLITEWAVQGSIAGEKCHISDYDRNQIWFQLTALPCVVEGPISIKEFE